MKKRSLITLFFIIFLLGFPIILLGNSIKSGSYFSPRQDVVETDTGIHYTEEIIYLNLANNTCQYLKERTIETKGLIPALKTDSSAEFLKYIGDCTLNKNVIIMNMELTEAKNSTHELGEKITIKLKFDRYRLINLNNDMVFQYVMK